MEQLCYAIVINRKQLAEKLKHLLSKQHCSEHCSAAAIVTKQQ